MNWLRIVEFLIKSCILVPKQKGINFSWEFSGCSVLPSPVEGVTSLCPCGTDDAALGEQSSTGAPQGPEHLPCSGEQECTALQPLREAHTKQLQITEGMEGDSDEECNAQQHLCSSFRENIRRETLWGNPWEQLSRGHRIPINRELFGVSAPSTGDPQGAQPQPKPVCDSDTDPEQLPRDTSWACPAAEIPAVLSALCRTVIPAPGLGRIAVSHKDFIFPQWDIDRNKALGCLASPGAVSWAPAILNEGCSSLRADC